MGMGHDLAVPINTNFMGALTVSWNHGGHGRRSKTTKKKIALLISSFYMSSTFCSTFIASKMSVKRCTQRIRVHSEKYFHNQLQKRSYQFFLIKSVSTCLTIGNVRVVRCQMKKQYPVSSFRLTKKEPLQQ